MAAAPLADLVAELLKTGSTHALADQLEATHPTIATLLREPNPFGKPQKRDVWSRCYADVLLIRIDLKEQRNDVIEVAIALMWKFGVGKSGIPGLMAEGRIERKYKARAAALVEAMTPRVRKQRVAYLREVLTRAQTARAAETESRK